MAVEPNSEAIADVSISGENSIVLRRGGEAVANSWESEGELSPIMMAGVRTSFWEDEGEQCYREKLFQEFSKIDKDSDGNITRDELRQYSSQYCEGDQLDGAIKALDVNQDGNISFEEFYAGFKAVKPMINGSTPRPAYSTPLRDMVTSYVMETGGDEEDLEWESIMKKFSIDSDSPLFKSKELRQLIARLEHQSPHLLDTMEQVISFLHADWQQLKRDCDNLHNKLKRESHYTAEQALEYDETLKEQLEKEREVFTSKEHHLKTKLDKQLKDKEDYILQVLAQKRKLEEQLNMKEKEHVSLKQQNKELESVIKDQGEISSSRSTPTFRRSSFQGTRSPDPVVKTHHKIEPRSSITESCSLSDQDETTGDDGPVTFELSYQLTPADVSPPHVDHMSQKSKSAISLAEEFIQLDQQIITPPVVLHLPSGTANDSCTHLTSGNVLPGDTPSDWSPMVGDSPLMSTSLSNSCQISPPPPSSTDGRESPITSKSREQQRLYRAREYKEGASGSPDQGPTSHDQLSDYDDESPGHTHDHQKSGSHDHTRQSYTKVSHDAYITPESFSCPDLLTLDNYKQHTQHLSCEGHSAIWNDCHHDNCASMVNIHVESNHGNRNLSPRPGAYGQSSVSPDRLPSVAEESSPSTLVSNPPSSVYKVVYLGNSGVGKSSMIKRLSSGSFDPNAEATIGMDYVTRTIVVDNRAVLLQLWDTAGQERFGPITAVYCRRADAFVLVYDITNRSSFAGIRGWADVIKATLRDESSVLLLIGNKRDATHGEREVSTREGEKMAEQLGAIFMETSARSGNNVWHSHEELSRKLLEREDENMMEAKMAQTPASVYINAVSSLNKKKCMC